MPNRKEGEYVQVCPECKSTDIDFDTTNPLQAIGVPGMRRCNACGHLGQMFPEVAVAELKEVRSEIHKESQPGKEGQPRVDISYGKFVAKAQWKIEAPLVIGLSIFGFYLGFWPSIFFLALGLWMAYVAYFKKIR